MNTTTNLMSDVGTLLKIPAKVTTELTDKACLCIGSAISEAKRNGESQLILNIGIGALSINLIDMQCKFVPSKSLKTAIKNAMTSPVDPLELALEQAFAEKLLSIVDEEI
jgi:hypothetical protein